MTFEEEFPSLKGKIGCIATTRCEVSDCDCEGTIKELIQGSCLDKERVKKAIEKAEVRWCNDVALRPLETRKEPDDMWPDLKEELGL